jgi:hypothetical protein
MGFKIDHVSQFTKYHWMSAAFSGIAKFFELNGIDPAKYARSYADR